MRKGESIFKRKDGRFEGRYIKEYINNKAIYGYVYGKTYNECKKKRNLILLDLNLIKIRKNKKNDTLNSLINKWLINKRNIKESTYSKYYNVINKHIKNEIGLIKINKLNESIVNNFIDYKLKNNNRNVKKLSNSTVYAIRNILKQVFKENNIQIQIKKIKMISRKGKSLNSNDRKLLEEFLLNSESSVSTGILLSLLLGIRESEVCGIRLSDIDLDNGVIKISRIVSRIKSFNTKNKTKLILSTPKTDNSRRILPIPTKLFNRIQKLKSMYNNNNYLLTCTDKFMDPRTFYSYYKKISNKLNINYTYHDLRHTFASNCMELGIDYKSLMELLGHSNISTTMNIYVHSNTNLKRKFINQL